MADKPTEPEARESILPGPLPRPPYPGPIPKPTPPPPPPPFQAARYTASLDSIQIINTRSRDDDSDKVSVSVATAGGDPQTVTKDLGDVDNGTIAVNLHAATLSVSEPHQVFAFNYLVLNSGHEDWEKTNAVLHQTGSALASAGAKAATTALGTVIGAEVGGVVLPVIGSILGAAAGWIIDSVVGLLTANCDGPVAAEQVTVTGDQLWANTQHGTWSHSTYHPGVDSSAGCGSNSIYIANWSIRRS